MSKPRKHAELIKQWADDDSLEIETWFNGAWVYIESPCFLDNSEYRIKPTKPSIDWSHLHPDYVQIAVDEDGRGFAFTSGDLEQAYGVWRSGKEVGHVILAGFKSFKRGTCDWKDSLVQRPEGE